MALDDYEVGASCGACMFYDHVPMMDRHADKAWQHTTGWCKHQRLASKQRKTHANNWCENFKAHKENNVDDKQPPQNENKNERPKDEVDQDLEATFMEMMKHETGEDPEVPTIIRYAETMGKIEVCQTIRHGVIENQERTAEVLETAVDEGRFDDVRELRGYRRSVKEFREELERLLYGLMSHGEALGKQVDDEQQ